MTGQDLLRELETRGLLAGDALESLKKESLRSDRPLEAIIFERKLVDDEALAKMKSEVLGVPYEKIVTADIPEDVLALVPENTVRTYGVVPISQSEGSFVVGMLNPDDPKAQEALRFIARKNRADLGVYLISYGDFQAALRRYSPYKSNIAAAVQSLRTSSGEMEGRKIVRLDEDIAKGGDEAPVIKIVSDTFREAVEGNASDIHIEPQENTLRIRFRIDGDLHEVASLPSELAQPVISRVKVISSLKLDETRVPQDGRFRAKVLDRDIDFRVATFPTPLGEKIAIRVLDPTTGLKSFNDLGLSGKSLELVETGLKKPFGMILITGPTGSGKTTTLYALLQKLNRENVNIVSLEDPVEYFVQGLNQSQVRPEIGYDFASGLRQILRQDPDIIMVGEIRDKETAGLAVQAALTGHIVLSTLHTNNAAGVIPRLLDMGVDAFLLPAALNLMISQRLVGLLCPNCKKAYEAPKDVEAIITRALADVPGDASKKYKAPYTVYRAPGCPVCKNRGTVGRIALYEAFIMTPGLEEVIASGSPTTQKILKEAKAQGTVMMREDGVIKALEGSVAIEEVMRTTEDL
jgi:type IV pilus assembly protein PilB